jgi:hypothetical protein
MRGLIVLLCLLLLARHSRAQQGIRAVDFRNFTYPLAGPLLGHHNMQWLGSPRDGYSKKSPIHLVNGEETSKDCAGGACNGPEGFIFESVQYADLTGRNGEDAIVVLRYLTGGTQKTDYIYIYSFQGGKPSLRAFCFTGDRAYSGLYRAFGRNGDLVVDLFDPARRNGDCCSSGYVRTTYHWTGDRFVPVGRVTRGEVKSEED